jgi:hypothetical protein
MKRILSFALLLVLCAAPQALAGRIFGDIKTADGKPVAENLRVRVTQPLAAEAKTAAVTDSTLTDKFGSYKLTVKEEGKCILSIVVEKQVVEMNVFSYKEATRYDLILEQKDGKLTLRRK